MLLLAHTVIFTGRSLELKSKPFILLQYAASTFFPSRGETTAEVDIEDRLTAVAAVSLTDPLM